MAWHLIEGEAGCAYARRHGCVAVVVDALRASATAAMLLNAGAAEILVVREIEEALDARKHWGDALLFGERGGLPPEGFDFGNSPRDADAAKGRRVIFTTTTGAQRLVSAWGAAAVYMGSTVNASAVRARAATNGADVVLIPAGLATDSSFIAQEDWVAAAAIAAAAKAEIGEGRQRFDYWRDRIREEGILRLFETAPHAQKLRDVGLEEDIAFCAQSNITGAVPTAVAHTRIGVIVRDLHA
ncbi:MAG: 2-phosphosulfolactate phosphatase [Candidatus Hydrogenedentes bacterium]|nr:2-phosphosulfolactate phosphatase [Candidatus Hydrogenedentota bacterium]